MHQRSLVLVTVVEPDLGCPEAFMEREVREVHLLLCFTSRGIWQRFTDSAVHMAFRKRPLIVGIQEKGNKRAMNGPLKDNAAGRNLSSRWRLLPRPTG